MRIKWTPAAIENLTDIHSYVAEDKPEAASRLARRILQSVERLARYPHLGRPGREPGTRELIVSGTPYVIPYEVKNVVVILAVLHGAQQPPSK